MIILHAAIQPFFRPWITHGSIVKIQYVLLQPFVGFPGSITFHKSCEFLITLCIIILKKFLQNILLKKLQLSFICSPISRIQADEMKIIADHIRTEPINSSDLRRVDQHHLPLQMFIIRIFCQCRVQSPLNTLPHLSCSSPCKSHDQKPVNIYRL